MAPKRKPTKPVKAWAVIDPETGRPAISFMGHVRVFSARSDARHYAEFGRVARVEIREVGR